MKKPGLLAAIALSFPTVAAAQAVGADAHAASSTRRMHIKLATDKIVPVPIERVKGMMILPGMVAGKRANILFDTGTDVTLVDERLMRDQGLTVRPIKGGLNTGLSVMTTGVVDTTMALGDAPKLDGSFVATDLGAMSRALGIPIAAVMGEDSMAPFVIVIDPIRNRMAFGLPGHVDVTMHANMPGQAAAKVKGDSSPPANIVSKFVTFDANFAVESEINGEPCRLLVDYGHSGAVTLSDKVWDRVMSGIGDAARHSGATRSDGQRYDSRVKTADQVRVGDISARDVPVGSGPPPGRDGVDGMLGLGILASSVTVLNMPKKQLWFFPMGQEVSVKVPQSDTPAEARK